VSKNPSLKDEVNYIKRGGSGSKFAKIFLQNTSKSLRKPRKKKNSTSKMFLQKHFLFTREDYVNISFLCRTHQVWPEAKWRENT